MKDNKLPIKGKGVSVSFQSPFGKVLKVQETAGKALCFLI